MSILCGVCNAAPPKYKCPTCQIRYCSLACFKPHKETHNSAANITQADSLSERPAQAPVQPPQPTYNIYNLKSNPAFLDLISRYPSLKAQLSNVWHRTLPPSAPANTSSSYHMRGGRQGGGKFKQEKADEAAARIIGQIRDDKAAQNEGMREFVKLVASLPGVGVQQNG